VACKCNKCEIHESWWDRHFNDVIITCLVAVMIGIVLFIVFVPKG